MNLYERNQKQRIFLNEKIDSCQKRRKNNTKIYDCLKEHGQFINCDKIAISQEIEDGHLYELEVLKRVGFQEITSSNVDRDDYSLIKARKINSSR